MREFFKSRLKVTVNMICTISGIKYLCSLLRTYVEERPVRTIFILWFISLPFAALFSLLVALQWRDASMTTAIDDDAFSLTQRVQRVAEMTELKFDINRKLTALMATDSRIVAALKGEGDFAECTSYLQNVGDTLRLHRAFLLDKNGVCVASNDADQPQNLLGVKFADREYFKRAMAGEKAMQFVVGRISTIPGFHFSAPVSGPDGYIGVVVLKLDTKTLAQQLYLPNGFISDRAGVVVLSSDAENFLRVVQGGSAASLDPLSTMLRYKREKLEPLYMRKVDVDGYEACILRPGGEPYLCKAVSIGTGERMVYGFSALNPLLKDIRSSFRTHVVTGFIFFVLGFAVIIGTTVNLLRDKYLRRALQSLNETLRVQAQQDSLTGLLNRRMFDEMGDAWFAQALRLGVPFSLVLFDIDHFKRLNDAFGHQAGDQVLRELARCVKSSLLRQSDRVFRIGGEEFAVLASAGTEQQIFSLMEMLRKAVEDLGLHHPDGAGRVVTISLGGLLVRGCCDMSFDAAFRKADEALYRAKAEGRNRSVMAVSCPDEGSPSGCDVSMLSEARHPTSP